MSTPKKLEGMDEGINLARNMVPYDYLVIATGSNYSIPDSLNTPDPKLVFRADISDEVVASYPRYPFCTKLALHHKIAIGKRSFDNRGWNNR